jgi:Flp pilus assembly protein TadD
MAANPHVPYHGDPIRMIQPLELPSMPMPLRLLRSASAFACACAVFMLPSGCKTRPVESVRESGEFALKYGNYEKAASEYGEIVERHPGDWDAQYQLGMVSLKLERWDDARRALEQANALRPNDNIVADGLAEAMFRQEDKNQLYAFLRERAQATQSVRVYLQLSRYALAMGDADSASTAAETAILIDDGLSTDPYLQAYAVAERIGDMDAGVRRLRQAYGINPEDRRVIQLLDDLGEIRGPTLALPPGR